MTIEERKMVWKTTRKDLDGPITLRKALKELGGWIQEFGSSATIDILDYEIEIKYERPETDEEMKVRLETEQKKEEMRVKKIRRDYERLVKEMKELGEL